MCLECNSFFYCFSFNQGRSTASIWLKDLECTGSETRLFDCSHASSPDCYHSQDVGLICLGSISPVTPTSGKQ